LLLEGSVQGNLFGMGDPDWFLVEANNASGFFVSFEGSL
jgi:hypothetical protein